MTARKKTDLAVAGGQRVSNADEEGGSREPKLLTTHAAPMDNRAILLAGMHAKTEVVKMPKLCQPPPQHPW